MASILSFIVLFFVVVAGLIVLIGQVGLLRGRQPKDLGALDGKLKPPAFTPNSISSQAFLYPHHPQRQFSQIEPLHCARPAEDAIPQLATLLAREKYTRVVERDADYLYVQCRSRWLGLVDDLEFWVDRGANKIHVRSASRLGRKDFGRNRARVEKIRAQFERTEP